MTLIKYMLEAIWRYYSYISIRYESYISYILRIYFSLSPITVIQPAKPPLDPVLLLGRLVQRRLPDRC